MVPVGAQAGVGKQINDPVTKRIENLEQLFRLRERWEKFYRNYIAEQAVWLRDLDDSAQAERELREEARRIGLKAAEQKYLLLQEACLEFLCGSGLKVILEESRRQREEKQKLAENENST